MAQRYGGKIVTDGLVLSMDAADIKSSYANVSNHDTVTELAFVTPGGSGEELIEVGNDPWGKRSILDRSINNDATSNYDGGDTSAIYNIDSSAKYRFTYFFRVDRKGSNGTLYFGLYGYNSSTSNIGVHNNGGSAGGYSTTNPYFAYPGHADYRFEEGKWYMFVAYVHPVGSTSPSDSTAGFYDMTTGLQITGLSTGNVSYNAVWVSGTAKTQFRYYLYYSTDSNVAMSWYQTRIDKIDGNEPSITDMLNQCPDTLHNLTGNGYNLKTRNGLTYNSTNKAVTFNGSTDWIQLPTPNIASASGTNNSTVIVFCKPDSSGSDNSYVGLVSWGTRSTSTPSTARLLSLYKSGSTYYVSSAFWGNDYVPNNLSVQANAWNFIAMVSRATATSNNVTFYRGNSSGFASVTGSSSSASKTLNTPDGSFAVGVTDYPGRYFKGDIALVQVYNRELSQAEVLQNYNAQKSRFGL